MNTDKVLALAREADFSEAETWLYADRMGRFAALIQQQMEADGWRKPQQVKFLGMDVIVDESLGPDEFRIRSKERK